MPNSPKKELEPLSTYLRVDLREVLDRFIRDQGCTLVWTVNKAIEDFLAKRGAK